MTQGTNPNDSHGTDPEGYAEEIDTEAVGRALLARQSEDEKKQARKIFDQLVKGNDLDNLRGDLDNLGRLRSSQLDRLRHEKRPR